MRAAQPRLQATAALPLEVSGAMSKECSGASRVAGNPAAAPEPHVRQL